MGHGLMQYDKMAYAGAVPWHGLGKNVGEKRLSAAEMIEAAGLDWVVETVPLFAEVEDYKFLDGGLQQVTEKVPTDAYAVVRRDINKSLGVVGNRYTPIQNTEIFSFFDNIVEEGAAIYETAGSLFNGEKVWALAKLPEDIIVPRKTGAEDVTKQYVLLHTCHNGKGACWVLTTPIRVVCNNTLTASLRVGEKKVDNKVIIRHTPSAQEKLKEAHNLMTWTTTYYQELQRMQEFLAGKPVTNVLHLNEFLLKVFPDTTSENSRMPKVRNKALEVFREEADTYGADWLSALNAATGLVDNETVTSSKAERKLDSIWFGEGSRVKDRAMEVALSFAGYDGH